MARNWDEIIGDFEDYLYSKDRAKNSVAAYSSALRKFGRFYRNELKKTGPHISRIQKSDLKKFVNYIRSTLYQSEHSINSAISALHAFSDFVVENGLRKNHIATGLRTNFIPAQTKPPCPTPQQLKKFFEGPDLKSKNGPRDAAILQLLFHGCLKIHEICELGVDDVHFHRLNGHLTISPKENGDEKRTIPLNGSVQYALRRYLKTRGEVDADAPLFLSLQENRISNKAIQYLVKKYLSIAGRSDLSASDLRYYGAIAIYNVDKDLTKLQQILGHRNLVTTARYISAGGSKRK